MDQEAFNDRAARTEEFVELFTRYRLHVYYFIRALIPNPTEAEEALQETNLVLWKKFNDYQSGTNFQAWACKIARLEVYNYRARRRKAELYFSDLFIEEIAEEASQRCEELELRVGALRYCKDKLSPAAQDLLQRRYRPGGVSRHVAEELGRPVRSVYKSLSRIRKTLLECINRRLALGDQVR